MLRGRQVVVIGNADAQSINPRAIRGASTMPLKNYTTIVPASRSIDEIQRALVNHGATGVLYEYEKGTGRISAMRFKLEVKGNDVAFSLPVSWRRFQEVLKQQEVHRWDDGDYVYRVAWRNIRDWVLAQLALYETQMAGMPRVFLPFVTTQDGRTLYQKVLSSPALLGSG